MTDEVREYAERKIWESGIRMVPGHYPKFENKEQVDDWLDISGYMFQKSVGQRVPEITGVDIQRYKDLLWRLKRNEDNMPLETLRTKYKTAYNNIRRELKEMTMAIIRETVYRDLYIERTEVERVILKINQAESDTGIYESINQAVYQEKCFGSIMAAILLLRKIIHEAAEEEAKNA
ncbi:hypothetical protein [Clostridium sp. FS41]|uniref:hypothetical protein n=1 Tax=Clostridium sp. FS41 TaxID=1609975 RepID=UPI0005D327BF|nr:hypothetical protein [Clostridium sp. FS41]KJJ77636.1 hypothetical protein CLFS41_03160 [Clostridium sp. FS41]